MKAKFAVLIFISFLLVSCAPETSKQKSQIGVVEVATFATNRDWISLGSPPNGAMGIISAKRSTVWVESSHGELFVVTLDFGCGVNKICWTWNLATTEPKDNGTHWQLLRGTDCTSINPVTYRPIVNPSGEIQECVYAPSPGINMVGEFYFALMSDGTIQFFDNTPSFLPQ